MNTVHTIVNKKTGESFLINNAGHGDITYHVNMGVFYSGWMQMMFGSASDEVNSDETYYQFTLNELGLPMSFWDSFFKNKGNLVIEQGFWITNLSGGYNAPVANNLAAEVYAIRVKCFWAKNFYQGMLDSEMREYFDSSDIEYLNSMLALIDEFIDVTSSIQNYEEEVENVVTYYTDRVEDLKTLQNIAQDPASSLGPVMEKHPDLEYLLLPIYYRAMSEGAEQENWMEHKVVTFDSSLLPAMSQQYCNVDKLNQLYNIGVWDKETYSTVDDYLTSLGIRTVPNAKYYYIVQLDESNCNGGMLGNVSSTDKIVQLVITNDERLIIDDRLVFIEGGMQYIG